MNINYNVTLKSSEVRLISQFMEQEKFAINCVDEFYRDYGLKLGGEILTLLKKNPDLCKNEFDDELAQRLAHHACGERELQKLFL